MLNFEYCQKLTRSLVIGYFSGNAILGVNVSTMFFRMGVLSLLMTTASALDGNLSAIAQTVDTDSQPSTQLNSEVTQASGDINESVSTTVVQQFPDAGVETASRIITPVPGTAITSSEAFVNNANIPTTAPSVAQADIDPGRPTRGGRSYVGIGANIGVGGGDSALSDGNFMIISKVGLSNTISVRPSAVLGDNTVILIPVTYDFSLQQSSDPFNEPLAIAPYVGAGAAIKTGDDSEVGFLVSGGVDFPLTSQFTANAAVNAGFFDKTDVGLTIGVGYNFGRY